MPEQASARSSLLFSRDALLRLIIPLVIEQLLLMTVGMADTVMVTTSGEAAVSGVSSGSSTGGCSTGWTSVSSGSSIGSSTGSGLGTPGLCKGFSTVSTDFST